MARFFHPALDRLDACGRAGADRLAVRLPPRGAISDSRRALYAEPARVVRESGSESLEISGSAHASARAIEAVFAEDFGRSVYLIPMSERRASLRTVDWVKDASVARFWPNRIVVGVTRAQAGGLRDLGFAFRHGFRGRFQEGRPDR